MSDAVGVSLRGDGAAETADRVIDQPKQDRSNVSNEGHILKTAQPLAAKQLMPRQWCEGLLLNCPDGKSARRNSMVPDWAVFVPSHCLMLLTVGHSPKGGSQGLND